MGLNIGAIARDIPAFRSRETELPANVRTPERASREATPSAPRPTSRVQVGSDIGILFNREPEEQIRAGFGENTISPPAAAILTLDEGVRSVAANLPTLEEQREVLRERLGELRESQQRQPIDVPERLELDASRAFAAERTRNFVNQLNDAAGTALARLQGEEPERRVPPATLLLNQQVFEFPRENTPQFIDVLA